MVPNKISVAKVIPTDMIATYGQEIIAYAKTAMKRELAESMMDILANHNEIIVVERELPPVQFEDFYRTEYKHELVWRPLICCKDCKHCQKIDPYESWCAGFGYPARMVTPTDFCSYGERREEK